MISTRRRAGVSSFALAGAILAFAASLSGQQPTDFDLDGIPDPVDTCPRLPNPRVEGEQEDVCSRGVNKSDQVYLQSRTFKPRPGLSTLPATANAQRHVLLHIERTDGGVVLRPEERELLSERGVTLWDYLPHFTYYATVPGPLAHLREIVALDFVRAISGLAPVDRIARSLRATRRASSAPLADGRQVFSVELFPDVSSSQFVASAAELGAESLFEEDTTHFVAVDGFQTLIELARLDGVFWIDDIPVPQNRDQASLDITTTSTVDRVHGLNGSQLTVAVIELDKLDPLNHPDLDGRVSTGNTGKSDSFHVMQVSGIMVGDGTLDPTARGFLPEAHLVSYAVSGGLPKTWKTMGIGIPKDARNQHDAVLANNSWGIDNCNKIGEYHVLGKWRDKSVRKYGIASISSVGNTRGSTGDFAVELDDNGVLVPLDDPCERNLESLPNPIAKNDISVGSVVVGSLELADTSSVGPAIDGRLKPDLVAPGQSLTTPAFDEATGTFGYDTTFSGTSAAAPVVSGVYGQVLAAFDQVATVWRDPQNVPPSTVKAILIHTAKDLGPFGPDYFYGWGLVQAAPAVRITRDWDEFVFEGVVDSSTISFEDHVFDVNEDRFGLKVTMVYDDKWGTHSSTQALVNDLDLVVIDPLGNEHFPLDTELLALDDADRLIEAEQGARTCSSTTCADDRNNVEQVQVRSDGTPLPQGQWTLRVKMTRLESSDQSYSLVVSPNCPVRIFGEAELSADVNCPYDELEPVAVSIETDGARLDCNGHEVQGAGASIGGYAGEYAGIHTLRDGVTIQNCTVDDFDIGIDIDDANGAAIASSTLTQSGTAAVRASGQSHQIINSSVVDVLAPLGVGLWLMGDDHAVIDTDVETGAPKTGLRIAGWGQSDDGHRVIASNFFGPSIAIEMLGPATGGTVSDNGIFGARDHGVHIKGPVDGIEIRDNTIEGYGQEHVGIFVTANSTGSPVACDIRGNAIDGGAPSPLRTGIELADAASCIVTSQPLIENVGVGVRDVRGTGNEISSNLVLASETGIRTELSDSQVLSNILSLAKEGIVLTQPSGGQAASNSITDAQMGISVASALEDPVTLTNNIIEVPPGQAGIEVVASDNVIVTGNTVSPPAAAALAQGGVGISVHGSSSSTVDSNTVLRMSLCLSIAQSTSTWVSSNSVSECAQSGILVTDDSGAQVTGNDIVDAGEFALHYASGAGGQLTGNEISISAPGVPEIPHGIGVGTVTAGPSTVADLLIASETVSGTVNALSFGHGVVSTSVTASTLCASSRALNGGAVAIPTGALTIERNVLRGGVRDAVFLDPVDTLNNDWSEVPGLALLDADGDGYVDSGTDHIFSSFDYTGSVTGVGTTPMLTSVMTRQISDIAPVFASTASCP